MKKATKLALICALMFSIRMTPTVNLDDRDVRKIVTYHHTPDTHGLTITLKNILVECRTGYRHEHKLIGTYPNPDYIPYIEGFKDGGQSPYCLVHLIG